MQLAVIEPKVICCLGRVAAQTLLGTRAALSALRESVHFYDGIPVMATFHPAALLRNPHWKRPTWDDVRKLSLDRANAVKQALVTKYEFDPNKFIIEGKGWNEPADPDDPENQAMNRRVEISVYSPEAQ